MTRWIDPPPVNVPASFADLKLPPFIEQTLVRRGIHTRDEARAFLHPESTQSTPFPGAEPAVERINEALRAKEMICVWGDFDVDGQTSTALLVQTLRELGANVVYYIPIRGRESHGVHIESLKPIIDRGAKLIVTCDTGITAHDAIDYANSRDVDVVVTDHHDPGESLPNASAILNPKLLSTDHALKNLAGVGVAYKLAEALLDSRNPGIDLRLPPGDLLDLVALGLIADVALLRGETRSLAQKGIQALRSTTRLGLTVMAELSNTVLETLTEETIGFTFAPRLNAMGRLGDANPSVELLLTQDSARARVLAAQIEGLNAQRRLLTSQVYEAAEAQLRENPDRLIEPVIVLTSLHWPAGVVGIVANRLVDRYRKPAILLTESDDGVLRGSARSVEGLHITEAIAANREVLLNFGGHPMAAGLSIQKDNLSSFRRGLGRSVEKQLGASVRTEPALQIDSWLELDEINLALADSIESLAPFGAGNPKLTLATRGVTVKSVSAIGRGREHLRLTVEDDRGNAQRILWWGGAGEGLPEEGGKFDIAYSLRATTFRGKKEPALQFEAIRMPEGQSIEVREIHREIKDFRQETARLNSLPAHVMIWAEGADAAKGRSRAELQPSDEFAIWTTPPSPAELRAALDAVKPKVVYLFAVPPENFKVDAFLARLAGMAKFALNNRDGNVSVSELAAATAQRETAVRIGLEWLAAGGHVTVSVEGDEVVLSGGTGATNQYLQKEFFVAVRGILAETAAYREYFASASLESLLTV